MEKQILLISVFLLVFVSFVSAVDIAHDDFESNSFNGGIGWNGAWSYSGGCEISGLTNPIDNYHMRGDDFCDATRYFNTNSLASINVSFMATASGLEDGEICYYSFYNGTDYELITSLTNGDDDGIYDLYSFETSSFGSTAGIQMVQSGGGADWCLIDNINITGKEFNPPNITSIVMPLECSDDCYIDITISDVNSQDVIITNFDWFLYVPYLQIPALSPNLYVTLPSSPEGITTRIPIDMSVEFGNNNYPRVKAIISVQDTDGEVATKSSNLFKIRLDTYVDNVGSVNEVLEPSIEVHGTEYVAGDFAKVWLQLFNETGDDVDDALCEVTIYYPNGVTFVNNAPMIPLGVDGIYYYNFIAPNTQGVYPAVAECYYSTAQEIEYADSYSVIQGSLSSGTLSDLIDDDGVTMTFRETTASPARVEATFTFNDMCGLNVSEDLLTGISFFTNSDWNSVINDNIRFSVYNFTSMSWINLSNILLSPADNVDVSNNLETNNYTTAGIVNSSGSLIFRFIDTNIADNSRSSFDLDQLYLSCNQFADSEWETLKGSSEAHVSRGVNSVGEGYYITSVDKVEIRNDSYINSTNVYYTISSTTSQTRTNREVEMELFKPFPCQHILEIEYYNGTDWDNNISYTTKESSEGRCIAIISRDLEPFTNYEYRIKNEKYWQSELTGDYVSASFNQELIDIACNNYVQANSLPNFTFPISSNIIGTQDSFYESCYQTKQFYNDYSEHLEEYFFPLFNTNINITYADALSFEEVYYHVLESSDEIHEFASSLFDGLNLGNSYSLTLLNDPYPPVNPDYALYFANISTSALLYYNSQSSQSNILSVLSEINSTIDNINGSVSNNNTEIPVVMIGGTEYVPNDEGLVAVRLSKVTGGVQSLVTGASCETNILYPNVTSFVTNASMTEYGSGIYYYNFSVPSSYGVYIYSVDCNDGAKDYYAMNTFHVSPFYNWTTDLSNVLSYLNSLNLSIIGIDGDIQDIISNVTSNNNYLFSMNGTLTNVYNLLLSLNTTIDNIYTLSQSINVTILDIQGSVSDIESVVLDINGSVVEIQDDLIIINTSINTINSKVDSLDTKIDIIDGNVDNILSIVTDINVSIDDVLQYLEDINNTQYDYSTELTNIYSLLQIVNNTQVNYSSELSSILSYLIDINNTQFNYSSDFDNLLEYLIDINNTQYDYSGDFTNVLAYLDDINSSQVNYTTELFDIYSLLVNVNNTQDLYSTELADILAYLNDINNTQFNYTSDFNNLEAYLIAINNTQVNYTTEFNNVLAYLQDINDTQVNYSSEIASMLSYLDDINNSQVNYTTELNSIINYLQNINDTQFNYSSELADIYSLLEIVNSTQVNYTTELADIYSLLGVVNTSNNDIYSLLEQVNSTQVNYTSEFNNLLSYLIDINATQVNYTTELSDIYSLLVNVNNTQDIYSTELADIYSVLLNVNATQVNYSSEFLSVFDYLSDINSTQFNYTDDLNNIYSVLLGINATQVNYTTELSDIYSLLVNVNNTQDLYSTELTNIYSVLLNVNATQVNYTTELADMYSLLQIINSTQVNYTTELDYITTLIENVNGTQVNYSSELADIYSVLLNVNATQVNYTTELNNVLAYLEDINITTTQAYTLSLLMNTTLFDVYDIVMDMNVTMIDLYAVSLVINSSVSDIYALNQAMNISLDEIYTLNVVMNTSINDINNALDSINTTIENIDNGVIGISNDLVVMNGTINTIDSNINDILIDLGLINTTIENIQSFVITINTTTGTINANVIDIQSSLVDINNSIESLLDGVTYINGTIESIQDDILYINSTQADMYSLLQVANSTIASNNELLLSLNISCSELGIDIADLNNTLNNIYALELVMNDSIWFIENLSVVLNNSLNVINSTTMDTYQLLLSVNTTLVSYYDEFLYIQELINNQTEFLQIALADVSFFNESEVNASDYYTNHTLITQSILETQLMS